MASLPNPTLASPRSGAQRVQSRLLQERFDALADRWQFETGPLSNDDQIFSHPAYEEIIGLGEAAVPLILERMRRHEAHWGFALGAITGHNPVRPEDAGDVSKSEASWIEWGYGQGLIRRQSAWRRWLRR